MKSSNVILAIILTNVIQYTIRLPMRYSKFNEIYNDPKKYYLKAAYIRQKNI